MSTITRDVTVGIYDTRYRADIHADKILVSSPYLAWDNNNSGSLAFEKYCLTCSDLISTVKAYLDRGDADSAWSEIGHYIQYVYIRDYKRLFPTCVGMNRELRKP